MQIDELISGLNVEDYQNEFKSIIKEGVNPLTNERYEYNWLKTICAFANSQGGTLYVGIDDKTHTITSLSHNDVDKIASMVQRLVNEHIEPPLVYKIDKIAVPSTKPLRYILKIIVEKSKFPPLSLKFNGVSTIYVRHFGLTSVAKGEEIRNMIMNSEFVSFDTLETDEIYDSKDYTILRKTYSENNEGKELTDKDLINISFMDVNRRVKRGALLFKDNYKDSRTTVECSLFKGLNKGDNIFLANERFALDLISEYKAIINFVQTHSAYGYKKTSEGKERYIAYPERSLFEAIINALAHRNYFIDGSQTEINIYKDRLEIISPGSLVNSKWLQREKNLSSIPPIRRNNLICEVFAMLNLMDRKGSGFDKIIEEYKPYGQAYAPYADSTDTYFSLTLPDLTHQGGLISSSSLPSISIIGLLDVKHSEKILAFCYFNNHTIKEITDFLNIKPSTYFRKEVIEKLVKEEYLIPNVNDYPITYRTNTLKVIPN